MNKYTSEVKRTCVEGYLLYNISQEELSRKYGVAKRCIRDWVTGYNAIGESYFTLRDSGLSYSRELKAAACKEYMKGKCSLKDIVIRFHITSERTLRNWLKKYNGNEELNSTDSAITRKGASSMYKGRETTYQERLDIVCWYLSHKCKYAECAEQFNVSYSQVAGWVKKYEKGGAEALVDRRGKKKAIENMTKEELLQAENRVLKAKCRRMEIENTLLKKLQTLEGRC